MFDLTTRTVAENLIRIRKERGLTQTDVELLSDEIGARVTRKVIGKTETFGRSDITVRELMALSATLRVSPLDLLLPQRDAGEVELTGFGKVNAEGMWGWMTKRKSYEGLMVPFSRQEESDWFVYTFDGDTWIPVTGPLAKAEAEDKKERMSWDPKFGGQEMKVVRRSVVMEEED